MDLAVSVMTLPAAIVVALRCLRKERQTFAFDAAIARKFGPGRYLRGDRALAAYVELTQAMDTLTALAKEGAHEQSVRP